jgi:hypothetical protein
MMTAPTEDFYCVKCYRESGGGTHTPASFVYGGDTWCARHAEALLDERTPEPEAPPEVTPV